MTDEATTGNELDLSCVLNVCHGIICETIPDPYVAPKPKVVRLFDVLISSDLAKVIAKSLHTGELPVTEIAAAALIDGLFDDRKGEIVSILSDLIERNADALQLAFSTIVVSDDEIDYIRQLVNIDTGDQQSAGN